MLNHSQSFSNSRRSDFEKPGTLRRSNSLDVVSLQGGVKSSLDPRDTRGSQNTETLKRTKSRKERHAFRNMGLEESIFASRGCDSPPPHPPDPPSNMTFDTLRSKHTFVFPVIDISISAKVLDLKDNDPSLSVFLIPEQFVKDLKDLCPHSWDPLPCNVM